MFKAKAWVSWSPVYIYTSKTKTKNVTFMKGCTVLMYTFH